MKIGYPVKFIYKGEHFITLYFDDDDKLLSQDDIIICYDSEEELFTAQKEHFNIDKSLRF